MGKQAFNSFWGELSVDSESVEKVDPPKKEDTPPANEEGQDDKKPPVVENTPPNNDPETPPTGEQQETEEEIEFTEDDAEKVFAVLEDEGVLDIGEEDEFDSSPKGIADMVATTVRNRVAKELQNIPPEVAEFYNHVKNGGSHKDFVPQNLETDWDNADLTDPDTQVLAMRRFFALQGLDGEEIQAEIDELVESGKIEARAEKASIALAKKQAKDAEAKAAADKAAADKNAEKAQKEIESINKTIDESDEIAGFKLDDKRRESFKNYLFKVNKRTGKTQMQENMADDDRRLKIAYLDFIDYAKEDLEAEVKTKLTRKRKKALSKHKDTNMSGGGRQSVERQKKKNDVKKIAFPSIFGGENIEVED